MHFWGSARFTFIPIRREKTLETRLSCIIHHVAHQDSVQFSHCHEVTRWRLSNLSALKGKLLYIQRGIFPINVLTVPLWVMLTLSLLQLPKRDFFTRIMSKTHWGLCRQTLKSILNRTGSQLREPKKQGGLGSSWRWDREDWPIPVCRESYQEEMRVCKTFSSSLKGRCLEFCNSSRF